MSILLVDDNEQNLYQMEVLFRGNGYQTVRAANGREALEKARKDPPELIIADILMPVMDGFALCREWKTDPRLQNIPFVFYTATYTDERDREFALSLGADRFLVKPEEPDIILREILAVLRQVRTQPFSPTECTTAGLATAGPEYLRQYNEVLIHKLEAKMEQLERANQALEHHIMEQDRAEQALRQAAHRLEEQNAIINRSPAVAFLWRAAAGWPVEFVSDNVLELGYSPEEFLSGGLLYRDLIHPEDLPRVQAEVSRFTQAKVEQFSQEYRVMTKAGETRWMDDRTWVRRDALGVVTHYQGVVLDITERKLGEEALRTSMLREQARFAELEAIMEAVPVPIWIAHDPECHRITGSRVGDQLLRIPRGVNSSLTAPHGEGPKHFRIFQNGVRRHPTELPMQRCAAEGIHLQNQELEVAFEDGTTIQILGNVAPLLDERGRPRGAVAAFVDVTEARALEGQLRLSQRLEAVGRLAGGVAHDFNNLLTVILGFTENVLSRLDTGNSTREDLEMVYRAGEKAAGLTQQLLAFSRRQVLEPREVNLNTVVNDIIGVLRRLIGEDIEVLTRLDPQLGTVKVDPSQMEQVLLNLCVNARDAMPHGGTLTVKTANVEISDDYVRHRSVMRSGPHVMLAVSDTGIGMTADVQAHIFEPFFTTKEPDKGTGLGLATVYGIVKQSDGYIWTYSEPDQGTVFKIYFPLFSEAGVESQVTTGAAESTSGSETILLVEDDEGVLTYTSLALEASGYTVLAAAGGEKAIEISRQHAGPIHLLLTDVVMSKTSGPKLAARLQQERPNLKVLAMSGYAADGVALQSVLQRGIPFLEKPFTSDKLRRKVRQVLDASP